MTNITASSGELEYLSQVLMVRMRPNVGALRFPTLIVAFYIVFPGKFSMYNTRQ